MSILFGFYSMAMERVEVIFCVGFVAMVMVAFGAEYLWPSIPPGFENARLCLPPVTDGLAFVLKPAFAVKLPVANVYIKKCDKFA